MSLLVKGVTKHSELTDVSTPHTLADLVAAVCSEAEADGKITTHKGDASAHHTPTPLSGLAIFGDGSDGNHTVTAAYTSGPITNNALTRDAFFNNLTVNNGVVLDTAGYRIFVKGTLTNHGYIYRVGNDGFPGNAGKAGGAALSDTGLGGSGAGANGGDGGNAGAVPVGGGGAGGDGGAGDDGPGGTGGSITTAFYIGALPISSVGLRGATIVKGGAGGGGGTAGMGMGGGGGGSGGGILYIAARILDNTDGYIRANGGMGGDGSFIDAGGGGGGGGGVVIYVYNTLTAVGNIEATGGLGGSGGGGAGLNGDDGSPGHVYAIANT